MRRSGFKGLVAAGVVATGMLATTTAVAASDIFLKITNVVGESQDDKHKGDIDVMSWSWGQSAGDAKVKKGTLPAMCIQDLHFVKRTDSASPALIMLGVTGQTAPDAVLTVRKSGGSKLEFLTLKMTNVSVSSYQTGGSDAATEPFDQVTLHFETMRGEYRVQREDGSLGQIIPFEVTNGSCTQ